MSFINNLKIKCFYQKIGIDQFGNKYFISKDKNYLGRRKRFVIYNGHPESSKIPPMWHSWLHYFNDEVPCNNTKSYDWQQEHIPNLTGTKYAYNPSQSKNTELETYSKWVPNKGT